MLPSIAIGCKKTSIPGLLEEHKDHIIVKDVNCVSEELAGHCHPEESYVDYECEVGYAVYDKNYGDVKEISEFHLMRMKCLYSYLWDEPPICIPDPNSTTTTTSTTTSTTSTKTTPTSTTISTTTTISKTSITTTNTVITTTRIRCWQTIPEKPLNGIFV